MGCFIKGFKQTASPLQELMTELMIWKIRGNTSGTRGRGQWRAGTVERGEE